MYEYELMYILHPRLTADEATAAIEAVGQRVTSAGGEILSVDNWGRRRLAYPIHHHFEGTYVLTTLRLPAEATAPLEAALRISEDVIRHLLVRGIIAYEGPPMQEERGRGQRSAPAEAASETRGAAETPPAAAAQPTVEVAPAAAVAESAPASEAEPVAAAAAAAPEGGAAAGSENGGSEPGPQAEGERAGESAE